MAAGSDEAAEQSKARRVACVIVNWNGFADTDACLRSLARDVYPGLRVVVVDNGSTDGSLERLRERHAEVEFIANGMNAGFPRACNVGARWALAQGAELIWLLNNDTEVESGTTAKLVAEMEGDERVGVTGAVLYRMDDPGKVQAWGGGRVSRWTGYNTHFVDRTELERDGGRDAYITFACALIRRECFEELGGLFEGAFMYFEDSDFCLRAQAAGWRLRVAEGTRILHREGGADTERGGAKGISVEKDRVITRAGLMFLRRHSPMPWISYGIYLGLRVGRRLTRRDWRGVAAVWEGAWSVLRARGGAHPV